MSGYLLDTNHLSKAVTPASDTRRRILELRAGGLRIGTCIPVLCEIETGTQQTKKPETYRRLLDQLLRQVRIWPIDRTTARLYGDLYFDRKQRGRVLSQVDMMLAALAGQLKLTLVSSDQDFVALTDIATVNWLSS